MNLACIDLGELVTELSDSARPAASRRAAIRFTGPSEPFKVLGDRAELTTTMITNLLDNAVKYFGDEPKIAIKLRSPAPAKVELYIRDMVSASREAT